MTNVPASSNQKRAARERRSLQNVGSGEGMGYSPLKDKSISPLAKTDPEEKEIGNKECKDTLTTSVGKRFNITSDYESNDSPSSSDHSDHIGASVEEGVGHVKRPEGVVRRPPNLKLDKVSSNLPLSPKIT